MTIEEVLNYIEEEGGGLSESLTKKIEETRRKLSEGQAMDKILNELINDEPKYHA